jgi:hypothetical protein
MPKFNFEVIKRKFTDKTHLSFPAFLQIGYTEEFDAFCLLDQRGLIYSRDEFIALVNEIGKFYLSVNPQDITDTNNDIISQSHSDNCQEIVVKKNKVWKYVYLISKGNNHYKIGITSNLKSRLSQIRTVEPRALLLHFFGADDALRAERILHKNYISKNVGGEWFNLSISDIEDIKFITEFKNGKFTRKHDE